MGGGINVGFYALVGFTDNSTLTMTDTTLDHNVAQGGDGGKGGDGGDGLGGGLAIQAGSSATVSHSTITHNDADGGHKGTGGGNGHGVGGGAYNLGSLDLLMTILADNDASTSNDDLFP